MPEALPSSLFNLSYLNSRNFISFHTSDGVYHSKKQLPVTKKKKGKVSNIKFKCDSHYFININFVSEDKSSPARSILSSTNQLNNLCGLAFFTVMYSILMDVLSLLLLVVLFSSFSTCKHELLEVLSRYNFLRNVSKVCWSS